MKLGLFYKNFAAHAGISHIGLGVAAQKNAEYLNKNGYDTVVVPARNNVDIVEAIRKHEFTHVVISAPWLTSLDLYSMVKHFKQVKFGVVSHSNIGFLQADPGALKLLRQYVQISNEVPNLSIGGNSYIFADWFSEVYGGKKLVLPNLYLVHTTNKPHVPDEVIRIGSFGAIRPQKNVMTAAAAAVLLSRVFGKIVEFHVSTGREDGGGSVILNAIRQMMIQVPGVELVERNWSNWVEFKRIIRSMDVLFQVSYTESFNMVTADGVNEGVPTVTSDAITWVPEDWKAHADNVYDVMGVASSLLENRAIEADKGVVALTKHNVEGYGFWKEFLS